MTTVKTIFFCAIALFGGFALAVLFTNLLGALAQVADFMLRYP